jgi:site-specific recombinase XerD
MRQQHYLRNGEHRLYREVEKVLAELPEPNRAYAVKYKDMLELNNRKPRTLERRLHELRYVLKLLPKDAQKATKEDVENAVRIINKSKKKGTNGEPTDQDIASITKNKHKLILKNFYKWLYTSDTYPDIVKWIKIDHDSKTKLPEEMLSEEDVLKLITACKNQRDKTIIALLWDTGMRVGELLNIMMKDINLNENISFVMVSGKTGDRRIPLVFSVPYLSVFVSDFRNNAKAEDPLLTIFEHNTIGDRQLDYPHVRKLLGDLRERSGLTKRIYPHLFRHSRATNYAKLGLSEQQAKMFFGWSGDSKMVAKYTHLSGKDIDMAILKANGILDRQGEPIIQQPTVKRCVKCHEVNEFTSHNCKRCGTPLDVSAVEQVANAERAKDELKILKEAVLSMMQELGPQKRAEIQALVKNL